MNMIHVLDHQEILQSAGYVTGHFNLLDDAFAKRVGKLTDWLNTHGNLTASEVSAARKQLLQIVITRVGLAAERERIPAISAERIERPVFVIGYARTGTTLLHSLLAEDDGNQVPLWWHTHQPSPPPGELPVAQFRLDLARRELERLLDMAPGLLTMHPYWDKGNDALIEDEEIHTLDFQNTYPTLLYQISSFPIMGGSPDPSAAYRFQRQFLQHLQWNLPKRRWAVKGCYHQFYLKQLFDAFPDALCIWPHREPIAVHTSTLAITAVLYGAITNGKMDWKQFGTGYLKSMREAINAVLADPLLDDPRIVHLRFKDLSNDPVATIKDIYGRAGFPYTVTFEQRMRAWLANPANRSDRYGRYPYSLEPFGLSPAEVGGAFAEYSRRFGLV
ncbi:MAG: sulfotransferase [Steroidobacteraceae bacterium]